MDFAAIFKGGAYNSINLTATTIKRRELLMLAIALKMGLRSRKNLSRKKKEQRL
jgi:hypothetical protein